MYKRDQIVLSTLFGINTYRSSIYENQYQSCLIPCAVKHKIKGFINLLYSIDNIRVYMRVRVFDDQ